MKIHRLYIKILLSFFTVLAITLSLILVLFALTAGRSYTVRLDDRILPKLKIFQALIQEQIDLHPDLPAAANTDLVRQLNTFAALFDARLWISDPAGKILVKTFEGPARMPEAGIQRQIHHDNGITLYHFALGWMKYHATIPVSIGPRELHLHLDYGNRNPGQAKGLFFTGLLAIGGVVALLLVPLATFITRRINLLNKAALEFADGNLSRRTQIRGHDEIAELGTSFNLMADRLTTLIRNAKELSANISHELRSPLARLRLSKELIADRLARGDAGEKIMKFADNMEADICLLDTLVAQMLTLSKMDYQESELTRETFSFSQFLSRILEAYAPLAARAGLQFETRLLRGDVAAHQDKSVVKSVLTNLLDNALKYASPNGTVLIEAASGAGRSLVFSVANPCPPLSREDMARLFQPFFRVPGRTAAPGSGLGLAIAKKQVRRCGGDIIAEQTETGIVFRVRLPRG